MQTCPTCSRELLEDSSFCPACGSAVGPAREAVTGSYMPFNSPLPVGRILAGHFRVGPMLGKGGMGEVYQAHDAKLGRDVALKMVRGDLAGNPETLARLQREARLLAALNHPHLAQLYSLEQDNGIHFLIMELVPGPTLAERLKAGRLPLAEALQLARQLAEALETAHERGIVHRDLKPANIKVSSEGQVKVLDFGLAKLTSNGDRAAAAAEPTTTQEGVVLGTPAYMSPEQARGLPLDKRTDVWSWGCILFEMLAGKRAFRGSTASDAMAAILEHEPDWKALPADVPPPVRGLLMRCLRKDVRQRLHDIGDARIELEDALAGPHSASAAAAALPSRRWLPALLGGLGGAFLVGVALVAGMSFLPRPTAVLSPPPTLPQQEWAGDLLVGGSAVALEPHVSPDGRRIAFFTLVDGQTQLAVMELGVASGRTFRVLTNKKDAGLATGLCWSPDSARLYFCRINTNPFSGVFTIRVGDDRSDEQLVLADAGHPQALPDGDLLVERLEPLGHQIYRLSLDRGTLNRIGSPFAVPNPPHVALSVFPDGKEAVFVGRPVDDPTADFGFFITDLDSGKIRRVGRIAGTDPALDPAMRVADDTCFYTVQRFGDLRRVVQIARHGEPSPRACVALPWAPTDIDVDSSGSVFVEHANRPDEVLQFSIKGGVPARLLTWDLPLSASPMASPVSRLLPLPGGQVLVPPSGWGTQVQLAELGKGARDFIQTTWETSMPAAALGADRVVVLHGTGRDRKFAVVAIRDGRILQRVEDTPTGNISFMACAPDGKALFFVENGMVWRISLTDPKARRQQLCPGLRVAPDPNGRDLIVVRLEKDGYRLVRIPQKGGEEKPIPFLSDELRLNRRAVTDGCVAPDGRVLVCVASANSWYFGPALLDPATGKVEKIALNYEGDVINSHWQEDGRIVANGMPIKTELWRFRRVQGGGP